MTVQFRTFGCNEAMEAAPIIVEAYAGPPWHEEWTIAAASARLRELSKTPDCVEIGAFTGETIIGFSIGVPHTSAAGRELYLAEIAVLPAEQRKGVGRGLVKFLEFEASARGFSKVWLVSRREGSAAKFYDNAGYTASAGLAVYARSIGDRSTS